MRWIKRILLGLLVVLLLAAVVGLLLPREVHVERTAVIDAPQATVFTLLNGFKRFNEWSPWAGLDPDTRYEYAGPATGAGARMSWHSENPQVGSGSQEIVESVPWERIGVRLDFGAQGTAEARYLLEPGAEGTRVTWSFDTDLGLNPISRYFGLMFDAWIGKDYEQGLDSLGKLARDVPGVDFSDLEVGVVRVEPRTVAYVSTSSSKDATAIGAAIGKAYGEVGRFMSARGLTQAGPPITINTRWEDGADYEFDAAIPIDRLPDGSVPEGSKVRVKETYGGDAVRAIHRGAYEGMPETYEKVFAYIEAAGLEPTGHAWDEYVTDPGSTPEAELITEIYVPVS